MASVHGTEQFASRWNEEVWERRNLDRIDDLIDDDFVMRDPALPEPVRGPEGVRTVIEMLLSAFPDLRVRQEDVVVEADRLALRNTFVGTHDGEYRGLEPTGEEVAIAVAAFQRIEDGALVEERQLVDRLGLLRQLGVVELPAGPPDGEAPVDTRDGSRGRTTASLEETKRVARRFPEEVATTGNIDLIDEICARDVVEHSSMGERRGREELKEQSEYVHAAFPDVSVTVEDEIAEGDTVAHRLTFRGTHEGEFAGVGPTGESVEIANMLFTRVEDGSITERWLLADMLGLLQQLGVVDPPGE